MRLVQICLIAFCVLAACSPAPAPTGLPTDVLQPTVARSVTPLPPTATNTPQVSPTPLPSATPTATAPATPTVTTSPSPTTDPNSFVRYRIEPYATADFPVAMAFAPDGRLFFTEKRTGNVRVVGADGVLQTEPVIHLDTDALTERGMLGIAIDPLYPINRYIWVVHTAAPTNLLIAANNIVRFYEVDGIGYQPEIMLTVPIDTGGLAHNGGNIHFGPSNLLYVSFGDYQDERNSQDMDTIPGKIHRFQVTPNGLESAAENPFPGSSIFAYGLRNPFDFTLDPFNGRVISTENGPRCDDEINLILPGYNYGWRPQYSCVGMDPINLERYAPPMHSFTPTEGLTGITVYTHSAISAWYGQVFFCSWVNGTLRRAILNNDRTQIIEIEPVDLGEYFCRVDIEVGPEGGLYFTAEDGIYRLLPIAS